MKIAPKRFIKFEDFGEYQLEQIFKKSGLDDFMNYKTNNTPLQNTCYHDLMAFFYANIDRNIEEKKLITSVLRMPINFGIKQLGIMLSIPYSGEDEYMKQIVKPNSGSKIEYKHLTSLGKFHYKDFIIQSYSQN